MMRTRLAALLVALVVVTGCAQSGTTSASPAATTATATAAAVKANTFDIQVDAKTPAFNLATTAYFPNALQAHPGDTVRFTSVDRGEPHTVAWGSLIDAAAAALAKQPPPGPNGPPPGPPPPEFLKIPPLINPPGPNGPPSVSQSAGQPCFLASGDPPASPKDPCPKVQQPDFDGTQTLYNSGWLPDKAVFSVKLADTIKPGVYTFMCMLHLAGMTGQVTVVDKTKSVQTQDALKTKADEQLAKIVQGLQGPVSAAAKAPVEKALAGILSQDVQDGLAISFAPKDLAVPVGGSITWTVLGPHTVTFNGPQDAVGSFIKEADGTLRLNPKSNAPQDGPGQPPPPAPGTPPGPPPPGPIVVDSGPWAGKTFRSSGLFISFPPVLFGYKVTFTQPGTYQFRCNFHPDMEGTVKVGQ